MQLVASQVLQSPVQLGLLCTSLCQCFKFDRTAAGLLLHAPQEGGSHTTKALPSSEAGSAEGAATDAEVRLQSGEQQPASAQEQHPAQSAILLPRMPNGLAHISSQESYEAVASVARTAGRVASLAGESHTGRLHTCMPSQPDQTSLAGRAFFVMLPLY